MDEQIIPKLAKNAIAVFLIDWEDTDEAQVVERDGIHFLIVKPKSPFSAALHIDLKERCEKIITSFGEALCTKEHEDGDVELVKMCVLRLSQELTYIAKSVPGLLSYSLYLLDLLAYRERLRSVSESLTQDGRERAALVARILTQGLLLGHDLIERKKPGVSGVLNDTKVLAVFLELRGEVPSIRRLAKELDTEPATVRSWLRKKGYSSPKDLANDLVHSNTKSTMDYLLKVKKVLEKEGEGEGRN